MHDTRKTIKVCSGSIEPKIIKRACNIIHNNGVVIFPTQCLYGIAVNALDEKAVKKVFDLKQRPLNKPILTLIHSRSQLLNLIKSIPLSAKKLMDAFWPGNLTIVFNAKDNIPTLLTANTGKIGIRIPSHPVAEAIVKHIKTPVTGTSANLSGHRGCNQISHLNPSIIEHTDLILDAGKLKKGTGSTIVDVTSSGINIIRQGIISELKINEILDKF